MQLFNSKLQNPHNKLLPWALYGSVWFCFSLSNTDLLLTEFQVRTVKLMTEFSPSIYGLNLRKARGP